VNTIASISTTREMETIAMPWYKSLRSKIIILSALLILAGGLVIHSQETQQPSKALFSVNVDVVNVFVTVRDKKGNIVNDLTMENFTLSEDGRKQTIKYFSRETDLPLTIGLIVDTTPSENKMLEEQKRASRVFLDKMLRPSEDYAFLIQFAYEIELLGGLTSSRERLANALDMLERHKLSDAGRAGSDGRQADINTVLADAIYLASTNIMNKQEGRKALIIMGDGWHLGNGGEMAVAATQRADTLIYTIRIVDKAFGGGGSFGFPGGWSMDSEERENLKMLSGRTGGTFFEVSSKETLEQIYGKIEEDLRSQYSLGYTPDSKARKGYRKIKIDVQKRGMVVRGREGYYPRHR
jgi:VWFA-related protein